MGPGPNESGSRSTFFLSRNGPGFCPTLALSTRMLMKVTVGGEGGGGVTFLELPSVVELLVCAVNEGLMGVGAAVGSFLICPPFELGVDDDEAVVAAGMAVDEEEAVSASLVATATPPGEEFVDVTDTLILALPG